MSTAPQRQEKAVSAVRNVAVSYADKLDAGELLTGAPTVIDVATPSPIEVTISNVAVNTAALTINGVSVPIGEAVQFKIIGGTANTTYDLKITATTDSTPAQTLIDHVILDVIAD